MPEGKRPRRRRGRRGGGQRAAGGEAQQPDAASPQPPDGETPPGASFGARAPRRDNRRASRSEGAPAPPGAPGPSGSSESPSARPEGSPGRSIRRAPDASRRQSGGPPRRDDRPRRGADDRRPSGGSPRRDGDRGRPRGDDRGPRVFETPIPQDERSVELGAAFREAQMAMRDARKALDKRKAEYSDEPEWLLVQLTEAETRFTAAADEWAAHLETTGRKVVRNR